MRRLVVRLLIFSMAAPWALAEPTLGALRVSMTMEGGRRLSSPIEVRLVHLDTGRVTEAKSGTDGMVDVRVEPGLYGIDIAKSGLEIVQGPHVVAVAEGERRVAALSLSPQPAEAPPASGPRIVHEAVGCMLSEENPEVTAVIEPAAGVTEPRVYFHAARESQYYYVDMMPEVGRFIACLPAPKRSSGPITYYISASEGGVPSRIADIEADVVTRASACPTGRRLAVVCPCAGAVAAYLPSGVAALPPGFAGAAVAGVGITSTGIEIGTAIGVVGLGILLGDNGAPASPSR